MKSSPQSLSRIHTLQPKKNTLPFFKRISFIYFFCYLFIWPCYLFFGDREQQKSHSEISRTADDQEKKSCMMLLRSSSLYPTHTLDSDRERSRRHFNLLLQPREEERYNLNSHKAAEVVLFIYFFCSSLYRHCILTSVPLPAAFVSPPASSHKMKKCGKRNKKLDSSAKSHD